MTNDSYNDNGLCKTIRQQIFSHLCDAERSARELSKMVKISEKEVTAHLSYIGKTAASQGKALKIRPIKCLSCGYQFTDRKRFTRPGRCPKCKGTHIETPLFRIDNLR